MSWKHPDSLSLCSSDVICVKVDAEILNLLQAVHQMAACDGMQTNKTLFSEQQKSVAALETPLRPTERSISTRADLDTKKIR